MADFSGVASRVGWSDKPVRAAASPLVSPGRVGTTGRVGIELVDARLAAPPETA